MSPSALPLISARDYPGFQQMIAELRQTEHEEWLDDHAKAIAYRRSRNGSVEIPVSPDEFDGWLKETGQPCHLELLWGLCRSQGGAPFADCRYLERLRMRLDCENDREATFDGGHDPW
jgi:hypothetical protein